MAAGYNNACEGVSPSERKRLGVHCVPRWYHAYLPWVEYTGRNALIIGLGIFPVVFVVMYVSAKLFGARAAPAPVAPIKAPKPKKNKGG